MMNTEYIYKLAKILFLRENFWGNLDSQDQNTKLRYIEIAERVFEDLGKAGLKVVELEDNNGSAAERPGNPPDPK